MNLRFWERKQNPVGRAIVLGLNIQGPDLDIVKHENFEKLAKDTFQRNATVYACISSISGAVASVPWILMRPGNSKTRAKHVMTGETWRKATARATSQANVYPTLAKALEETEVLEHPLLRLLERPNPSQGQSDFFDQLVSYWLTSGNDYLWALSTTQSGNQPRELWNLRPDRMEIKKARAGDVEKLGIVGGYVYKVNASDQRTWQQIDVPEQIIHFKFFNPTNDWYGMSPLSAAARDWQSDNKAADWNFSLIEHGARPGGALVAANTVADDVYERLKSDIEESYTGAGNSGRPLFLQGGITWEQMGLSPIEMDFLHSMEASETRICRAYRVPPEIFGFGRAGVYKEARAAFWHEACLPLLDRLRDMFNTRLTPLFGNDIYLDYDRDQIEAIQEDEGTRWDRLNKAGFLSVNEKRTAAGYDTSSHEMADTPVFLLNPTPGATGLSPGTPAPLKSLTAGLATLSPGERVEALDYLLKNAKLPPALQRQEDRLRALMARSFKDQGRALAAFIGKELSK